MTRRQARALLFVAASVACVACDSDERPRSLIDDLKIVAVQIDPPEAQARQLVAPDITVTTLVGSPTPLHETLEYAVIACTSYTGVSGCLEEVALASEEDLENGYLTLDESEYRSFFQQFIRRGAAPADGLSAQFDATFTAPLNYYYLLTEFGYQAIEASAMVLVCREGLCPVLDQIDAYLAGDPAAPSGEELMSIVSTPGLITSGAPISGVAMGRKAYQVSLNDSSNQNHNPGFNYATLGGCDLALQGVEPERRTCTIEVGLPSTTLETYYPSAGSSVSAQEAVVLRFYTTAGEMKPFSVQLLPSTTTRQSATVQLPAPEETPGEVGLFVVAEDSRAGMGFITARFGSP
jgi:hypothetical protein